MQSETPRLDGRSWIYLLALAVLWSISFIFVKVAVVEIPVLTLVLARVLLGALVLHGVVFATGRAYPASPALLGRYVMMGLINNVLPFALIFYAMRQLDAGAASILNALSPMFTLIVAHIVTADEKITPAKILGILLGFAGVAAMAGPQAVAGLTGDLISIAAMLLACFFYGLAAVYGRSFRNVDATVSATCQLSASTLLLAPVALIYDRPWELAAPGAAVIGAVIALALLSTALAYILYYALIRRAGATNAILVTLLIPVGGVFLGWLLLDEALSLGELAGMLLIGFGLLVIDGRALRRLRGARDRAGTSPSPPVVRPAP